MYITFTLINELETTIGAVIIKIFYLNMNLLLHECAEDIKMKKQLFMKQIVKTMLKIVFFR